MLRLYPSRTLVLDCLACLLACSIKCFCRVPRNAQVYTAEEKAALAMINYEEKAVKEQKARLGAAPCSHAHTLLARARRSRRRRSSSLVSVGGLVTRVL